MTVAVHALEATLCAAYREQAELYGLALALWGPRVASGVDGWLPQLISLLDRVAAIESRIAVEKQQWQNEHRPPSAELAICLARIAELLRNLSATVNQAIGQVESDRAQLVPQLEGFARLGRMQQAYQRTLQGPSHGQAVP